MTPSKQATSPPPRRLTPAEFRDVIGHFASGVTIVTSHDGQRPYATTVSAVASLSLDPPMILVCMDLLSETGQAIAASGRMAVAILGDDQADIAAHFALSPDSCEDRFEGVAIYDGPDGVPLLTDALATLECEVTEQIAGETHLVFLAEVEHGSARAGTPLAYYRGQFGRLELDYETSAYRELRARVLNRDIVIRAPLGVVDLAQQMSIPRGSAYHALDKLCSEGLVYRDQQGAFVVSPLDWEQVKSAVQARFIIEAGVVVSTVGKLSGEQLEELGRLCELTRSTLPDGGPIAMNNWRKANAAFHEYHINLCQSSPATEAYRQVNVPAMMASIQAWPSTATDDVDAGDANSPSSHAPLAYVQHRALVDAYEADSLERALMALDAHNTVALNTFEQYISRRGGTI